MRPYLANVLFALAIFVFGLDSLTHVISILGFNLLKLPPASFFFVLLSVGSIFVFGGAALAEVARTRVFIFTIWPWHFFKLLTWNARIMVMLMGLYCLLNFYVFFSLLARGGLTVEQQALNSVRFMSAWYMLFTFVAAMYYRYIFKDETVAETASHNPQ